MARYVCTACGYTFEEGVVPEKCPECDAKKNRFELKE